MEYTILWDDVITYLVDQVNDAIQDGWKPSGGVSVAFVIDHVVYHQAMTREKPKGWL